MGPRTLGILVGARKGASTANLALDRRIATDLMAAAKALGLRAVVLPVDDDLPSNLQENDVDGCLLALTGLTGGAGRAQALLSLLGVPFHGPPSAAATLAFDKLSARKVLRFHNLPTPPTVPLLAGAPPDEQALSLLGYPCVLKPRRGSLSEGLTRLFEHDAVMQAVDRGLTIDRDLLLERHISGTELQVVILDGAVLGTAQVDDAQTICPPLISRPRRLGVERIALRAAQALGTEALCRVDILLDERLNEMVLEVEPVPPLHRAGTVARVARAAGYAYEALFVHLLTRLEHEAVGQTRTHGGAFRPVLQ